MPRCTIARAALATLLAGAVLAACASSTAPHATTTTTSTPTTPVTPATPPAQWALAWSDEFDGPAGATFDRAKWTADTGGGGWGNQEREFYTTRPENVSLDGAGHLVITARAESPTSGYRCWYGACTHTSARLKTQGLFDQTYGRFEARIQIPRGQGIWPAFWMLGRDIDTVGWPRSGEIDIMENIGKEPNVVHGTIHGPGYSGGNGIGGPYALDRGAFADDFHVFAVEWEPGEIRWLVDGQQYRRTTSGVIPATSQWVFDHPFFVLLNLAVGGAWPGDPDATTSFPQRMVVDYVRVYKR
ncbi:glycoside hydrolase family 16 (plasmid) [Gemmatirosa kalamazoonensis]|uniref:Glycoside hydrolase family 16 n=1 Tax=Gemmatirosa kalamazoonensis TaxID=861299 RepID=W0RRS2_9BACT|nr:glycoside hydrolase family 16 [Gemmatirosa kalamazoonensis]